MILKIGERLEKFEEYREGKELKGITKNGLKSVDISFNCDKSYFEILQETIKANDEKLEEYDENAQLLKRYNTTMPSYSSSNENYHINLHLEEIETLPEVTKIVIEGIELEVTKFNIEKSEYDNNATIINLVYKIEKDKLKELNEKIIKKEQYFEVCCPEISDETIEMRYGQIMWSDHGQYYKYRTTLVEKIYDEKDKGTRRWNYPHEDNIMKYLSKTIIINQELFKLLKESNILDEQKENDINKKADEEWSKLLRNYNEVKDAEEEYKKD